MLLKPLLSVRVFALGVIVKLSNAGLERGFIQGSLMVVIERGQPIAFFLKSRTEIEARLKLLGISGKSLTVFRNRSTQVSGVLKRFPEETMTTSFCRVRLHGLL